MWVILCHLPEKGRKEIEEIVEEMKEKEREERGLIVLGFNDTSTLVGHFVSSPRDREKRDRRDSRRDEREDREERGTGVKVKKQKK